MIDTTPWQWPPAEPAGGSSFWRDSWHRLWQNKLAIFGLIALSVLAALCFASFLWQHHRLQLRTAKPRAGPGPPITSTGWAPTARTRFAGAPALRGGISLTVGLCATAVSLTIGVIYGAIAGFAEANST